MNNNYEKTYDDLNLLPEAELNKKYAEICADKDEFAAYHSGVGIIVAATVAIALNFSPLDTGLFLAIIFFLILLLVFFVYRSFRIGKRTITKCVIDDIRRTRERTEVYPEVNKKKEEAHSDVKKINFIQNSWLKKIWEKIYEKAYKEYKENMTIEERTFQHAYLNANIKVIPIISIIISVYIFIFNSKYLSDILNELNIPYQLSIIIIILAIILSLAIYSTMYTSLHMDALEKAIDDSK